MASISFDGADVTDITIDGEAVQEVTMDGDVVWTAGAVIIDGFEDNDLSEYSGDTGQYQTQTGTVKDGTYALQGTSDGSAYLIQSTSGLDNYPSEGDTFRWWYQTDTGGAGSGYFRYGLQDSNNHYRGGIDRANSELRLEIRDSGNLTTLASNALSISSGTWYELELVWQTDGTMTLTAYDDTGSQLAQCSATDTSYTSGGVGFNVFYGSGTTNDYYDHVRIV